LPELDELKFVRVNNPYIFLRIPRALFEQVKGYDFSVNRLIYYGASIAANPLTYIYAMTDDLDVIRGVFWARIDIVDETFEVYLISVEPEYQKNTLKKALKFVRELQEKERPKLEKLGIKLKDKIVLITNQPKAYEKLGAKPTKRILMEKNNESKQPEPDDGMVEENPETNTK